MHNYQLVGEIEIISFELISEKGYRGKQMHRLIHKAVMLTKDQFLECPIGFIYSLSSIGNVGGPKKEIKLLFKEYAQKKGMGVLKAEKEVREKFLKNLLLVLKTEWKTKFKENI
ncbi:hypothetical protein [Xanthovirga aplysinae]|uniref:hypothetical protein n=1 Tax=Xanthovirga aplysinae TaxID=2529853 RepID=UPI0012BCD0EA|nr:hypothetical protein [Xanthovirga aplysinae]MTI31841.1 hypothetical protein [Xanthovirga aplysinae]